MPERASTEVLTNVLRERAERRPDKLFWWAGEDRATYAEADDRSDRVAAGLAELGVQYGDRVAVLSTNRAEYLETVFGIAKLGAIQVPLNAYLRGDFLQYQLDQSGACVALADAPGVDALHVVRDRVPALEHVVSFDDAAERPSHADTLPYEEVCASGEKVPERELSPSDVAAIMYTSGTTGMPKGCMLAHGYYMHVASETRTLIAVDEDDVLYTALPLFHVAAQIQSVMFALREGMAVVVDPAFHVSSILDRWIETGATRFYGLGMMGMAMLKSPPSDKDRAHGVTRGACFPFPPEAQEEYRKRFGVDLNTGGYGQTETGIASMALPGESKPGSAGRPAPYYELALVDDDDNVVPTGEVGEIVVRPKGPNMMFAGYWRQPEATLGIWRNLWHHTGDFGRLDEDGFLYFVDRKKDSLRRRGENISSMEVEGAIGQHPKIAEVAVVAAPSELTEDDVMACIVLTPGESLEPEELFEFFKTSLPYFVVPRYVRIMEELPRTANTKVKKHLLRPDRITDDMWDFEALGLRIERDERR